MSKVVGKMMKKVVRIAGFDPGARFGYAYFDVPTDGSFRCPSGLEYDPNVNPWRWEMPIKEPGVDIKSHCTWAQYAVINKLRLGAWDLSTNRHEGPGMMWIRLAAYLDELSPDFFVYEMAHGHWRSGAAEYYYNGGLATLETWAARNELAAYDSIPVGTLKKFATGKGNCNKDAIVAAANEQLNLELPNSKDDEADAAFILKWAVTHYGEVWGSGGNLVQAQSRAAESKGTKPKKKKKGKKP